MTAHGEVYSKQHYVYIYDKVHTTGHRGILQALTDTSTNTTEILLKVMSHSQP